MGAERSTRGGHVTTGTRLPDRARRRLEAPVASDAPSHLSNAMVVNTVPACRPLVATMLPRGLSNTTLARALTGSATAPSAARSTVDPSIARQVATARGGGSPVPADLRVPLQEQLGTDLGGVRLHSGPTAAGLTRALEAQAFTSGQDVFFGASAYEPHSSAGRELIAHEMVHVAQQSSSGPGAALHTSSPNDAAEVEARVLAPRLAGAIVTGARPPDEAGAAPVPRAPVDAATASRVPDEGPSAPDLGTVVAVPALQDLRRVATSATFAAGAYTERGVRTVDALKASLVAASDTYTTAYGSYKRAIAAAGAEARNQQEWTNIIVGIGIGVGVGLLSAAIVPEGLALGWAVLAEAAGETVEAAAAAGVQATGITTVAGTDLQPGGLDPNVLSSDVWHRLADLYRGVLGVQHHTQYLPLVLGGVEYALGQFRLLEAGVAADMDRAELVDMAVALNRSGAHLRALLPELAQRSMALEQLLTRSAAPARPLREVEHDVWILWMATLSDDQSDVLDLDEIEDHLHAIGLLGPSSVLGVDFGGWTTKDDELEALAAARTHANAVRERYRSMSG